MYIYFILRYIYIYLKFSKAWLEQTTKLSFSEQQTIKLYSLFTNRNTTSFPLHQRKWQGTRRNRWRSNYKNPQVTWWRIESCCIPIIRCWKGSIFGSWGNTGCCIPSPANPLKIIILWWDKSVDIQTSLLFFHILLCMFIHSCFKIQQKNYLYYDTIFTLKKWEQN